MKISRFVRPIQLSTILITILLIPACGDAEPEEDSEVSISVNQESTEARGVTDSLQMEDTDLSGTSSEGSATVAGSANKAGNKSSETTPSASAQSTASFSQPASSRRSVQTGDAPPYSSAAFDVLLKKYVRNGRVNYSGFESDGAFTQFVASLEETDPSKMSKDEALAFWINAYNALVIRNVLDHPGTRNPLDVNGFFDAITFNVAGRTLTLNDIENKVIRPTYQEPLIHFGLVCAAVSCPPLIPSAYTEANVRSTLRSNAENYLSDTKQNRFDVADGTLYVSKIFEWYIADFGNSQDGIVAFARKYGPAQMVSRIEAAEKVKVKYNEYDWTINAM
jgi:hypothetical protein